MMLSKKSIGRILRLSSLEYAFSVLCLFIYSGALLQLVATGGAASQNVKVEANSGLIVAAFMATYPVFGLLILLRWRQVVNTLRGDTIILPLLGLVFLTYFWSDAPTLTLRRAIALLGTSLFGIYLASRYTIRQQLSLLAWAYFLIIVLSLLLVLALPSYGVSSGIHAGLWRGVFAHKNGLGNNMVISTIVFLLLAASKQKHRHVFLGCALASVFLLFMAKSGTALVSLGVVVAAFPIYSLLRIRSILKLLPLLMSLTLFLFISVTFVRDNFAYSMSLIGETPTLTNRTNIWVAVLEAISDRPLLGYGYEAFWRNSESSLSIVDTAGLSAAHAHNGILQSWLSIGFIGLTILIVGLWKNMLRATLYFRETQSPESYLPIAFFTLLFALNAAESEMIEYNSLTWVLYCSFTLSLLSTFRSSEADQI